ncbi:uncharacterized protein LOC127751904 [Frankliniella occidentalis]|uniref:Uncharacterized protein LOC127751904 n=1 Tax=Frankliniella occidentalis TaxID=133901 RepID=A0A9C6XAG8_FRAOC|nr:uncharacterized protein LOC127751904 [Frankliniella occidentalis]
MTRSGRVARLNRRNSMRTTNETTVYLLPQCPREYFLGYIMPKCSPFLHPLNRILGMLQSAGLIHHFKEKSYAGYHRRASASSWAAGESIRVKLADMVGPFCMLFTGLVAAIGALLGEQGVHRGSAYLSHVWREWRAEHVAGGRGRRRPPGRRRRPGRAAAPRDEPSWIRPPRGPPPPEAKRPPPPPPPYSFVL